MTLTGTIPVPFGWFRVADSADLAPGGLASVRVCERDLVVWRTVDGTASCADAWCPHLGAHLGVGGRVDGASIVCPFHGWEFGPDGANCRIPSSERIDGRARLRTHPVIERNGFVLAWVHPLGDPPTFDVPEFPETADPDYLPFIVRSYVINTSVQELGENGIDRCHFPVVHLADEPPVIAEYDGSGDIAHVRTIVELKTPFGDFPGEIEVHQYGPGISATRFIGFVDTLLIATQTPIERDRCELRFHFTVRRTGTEAEAREIAELYVGHIDEQAREDVPIWEHKAFVPRPALSDVDGPILEYRRWAARFQVAPAG